jgi:hypothetical protein
MAKALNTIYHNGKKFAAGEEVTGLKKDEMERLVKLGAIEDSKPAKRAANEPPPEE